ncbi:MAG: hypothetical protein ACTSP3_09665 [Candidatus Heimdallarchaeaceae archaeon]
MNIIDFKQLIEDIRVQMHKETSEEVFENEKNFHIRDAISKNASVQYPFAIDVDKGEVVYISEAQPRKSYMCLDCNQPMFPRALHSDKVRPHFFHKYEGIKKCEESYEHYFIKTILFTQLQVFLGSYVVLDLWYLEDEHQARVNLIDKITTVEIEYHIKDEENKIQAVADIALLDQNNKIRWALEIVHSHPVSKETLEFYKDKEINCIEIYTYGWKFYKVLYYEGEPVPCFDGKIFEELEFGDNRISFESKGRMVIRNKYTRPPESKMLYSLTSLLEIRKGCYYVKDDKIQFYLTGEDLKNLFLFLRDNQDLINILIAQNRKIQLQQQFAQYEQEQFKELEKVWRNKIKKYKQTRLN